MLRRPPVFTRTDTLFPYTTRFRSPRAALGAVEQATGEPDANVIGYCLGGTLLACTLAYMAAKKDTRVKSATFFTTMLDFEEAGELGDRKSTRLNSSH